MTTTEFKEVYWKYYFILERDVIDVEPYVSFHPDNYNCFSNEFIKLFQAICSEIDVISKKYCEYIKVKAPITGRCRDIMDYAKYILTKHPEIVDQDVYLLEQSNYEVVPWQEWHTDPNDHRNGNNSGNITPEWWRKYNNIKHKRSDKDATGKYNYQYASLYNVLNAMAALYVLEKYFYTDLAKDEAPLGKIPNVMLMPVSKLFRIFESEENFLTLTNI